MNFDVFISHSSKDKIAADATCAALEAGGIRCWIAPRDVLPGIPYAEAIVDAIAACRLMVVIVSSNANASRQMHREIERAASHGVPILPMRIEEIVPSKSLEYFLGEIHWLDALTPPLAAHLERLVGRASVILETDPDPTRSTAGEAQQGNHFHPAAHMSAAVRTGRSAPRGRAFGGKWLAIGGITVAAALLGGVSLTALYFTIAAKAPAPATASAPTAPPWASENQPPVLSARPGMAIKRTAAFGGSGGFSFDDASDNVHGLPISAIRVVENFNPGNTAQRIIGSIQLRWGSQAGVIRGGRGPNPQPAKTVEFAPDERIGRVDINWMSYEFPTDNNVKPVWVAGLAIWTDRRVYSFGNMTFGPTDQCILGTGDVLLGFHGRAGSYIDQIGCVVETRK
jgi:hypothetical protein